MTLKSHHEKTEEQLLNWVNANKGINRAVKKSEFGPDVPPELTRIISIVQDVVKGGWIIYYY